MRESIEVHDFRIPLPNPTSNYNNNGTRMSAFLVEHKTATNSIGSVLSAIFTALLAVAAAYFITVWSRSESELDKVLAVQEDREAANSTFTGVFGQSVIGIAACSK